MGPAFLFAHGAGAPSSSEWMARWAEHLGTLGPVQRFDYPYMASGSRRPDRAPVLIGAHGDHLDRFRTRHPDRRIFLVGKSMGGRMGCHLALEQPVAGLICLGYPLCGGGIRAKLRDQVLRELTTPVLFVQGTRDKLCPLDLLAQVRTEMTALSSLHVVETGDHSLLVTKTHTKQTGRTQADEEAEALDAIRVFVSARGHWDLGD